MLCYVQDTYILERRSYCFTEDKVSILPMTPNFFKGRLTSLLRIQSAYCKLREKRAKNVLNIKNQDVPSDYLIVYVYILI